MAFSTEKMKIYSHQPRSVVVRRLSETRFGQYKWGEY